MHSLHAPLSRRPVAASCLLSILLSAWPVARADILLTTEIMMGEIDTNGTMLGYQIGVDPGARRSPSRASWTRPAPHSSMPRSRGRPTSARYSR